MLSRAFVMERTWPFFVDMSVAAALLAGFYAILWIAKFWFSSAIPEVEIHRSPVHLPLYAFYSLVRIFVAYGLSLLFAVGYGYTAAYNKRLESLMIATLGRCSRTRARMSAAVNAMDEKIQAVEYQLMSRALAPSDDKIYASAYKDYYNLLWLNSEIGSGAGDVAGGEDFGPTDTESTLLAMIEEQTALIAGYRPDRARR